MKIYKVMKFWANGWQEGHSVVGTFSTKEKAKQRFKELKLKRELTLGDMWGDYIKEEEID